MAWYWWYLIAAYSFDGIMVGFYIMAKSVDEEEIEDSTFTGLLMLFFFSPFFAPFLLTLYIGALLYAVLHRKKETNA